MDKIIKDLAMKISGITNYPMPPIEKALREGLGDLKESIRLNDLAEDVFDKIIRLHARGCDSLMLTPRIDDMWRALNGARKKAGREHDDGLPKD